MAAVFTALNKESLYHVPSIDDKSATFAALSGKVVDG
jgi:hypothetical protein